MMLPGERKQTMLVSIRQRSFKTGTRFGLLALVLLSVAAPPTLLAQTALRARISLRAVTRDDIAASKLPAATQTSAGLSTVGIGQPAYLDALVDSTIPAAEIVGVTWSLTRKPADSQAEITDGPLPMEVPPYESADRQDYQLGKRALLRPDVAGVYMVQAVVQTAKNGSLTLQQVVTAGKFVGAQACAGCHAGGASRPWSMNGSWAKTAHASLFKDGVNGTASDHYAASCISCHTVGYDSNPQSGNGGFDDIAADLKWTFPTVQKAGTFEAMPEALKNVSNIQCENCHGPGSAHIASGGDPMLVSKSSESGACALCHAALTHHSKTGQWNNSVHASTTREAAGTGREGCVGCHTGTGFIDRMSGAKTVRTAYSAINCQACHEPHGQTAPDGTALLLRTVESVTLKSGAVVTDGGKGMLCMNCHQSRQNADVYAETTAGTARFGPHHSPQADMLKGVNGVTYGKNIPTSAHGMVVEDTCVGCHMQTVADTDPALTHAGGHTFKPSGEAGGKTVELVAACQTCHGRSVTSFNFGLLDYDNDGKVEGVQTEVQHLLDQLAVMLPPVGKPKTSLAIDATWTRAQLKASYNWQFVAYDGSLGVHNMAYTVGLLKASIADLSANK